MKDSSKHSEEFRNAYDDEIDLFEFFQTIWDGKWLIIFFVVLAVSIALAYSFMTKPKFEVSAPYSINIYPVSAQQICGGNVGCIENEVNKALSTLVNNDWKKASKGLSFSLITEQPQDINVYANEFENYTKSLTAEIYSEALHELNLIENDLNAELLRTERVATNILNAKRVMHKIDSGESVINLGAISVHKTFPKIQLILAIAIVLGGMIGVFIVLIRSAVKNRKEQLSVAK